MIAWYGCGKEADSRFGLRVAGCELRDNCGDGGLFDA